MKIDKTAPLTTVVHKIHCVIEAFELATIPLDRRDAFLWADLWATRFTEYLQWLDAVILYKKISSHKEEENAFICF